MKKQLAALLILLLFSGFAGSHSGHTSHVNSTETVEPAQDDKQGAFSQVFDNDVRGAAVVVVEVLVVLAAFAVAVRHYRKQDGDSILGLGGN